MGELSKGFRLFLIILSVSFAGQALTAQIAYSQNQCARLFSSAEVSVNSKTRELKVGTYNLLNLYIHKGNVRKETAPHEKPQWAIEEMAEVLREQNYDIFVAQEVESISSAKRFNEQYLGNTYNIFSTTTNDARGLYVVFFVKKTLPYHYKLDSHAQETWFDPLRNREALVFERDLPTLHIYKNRTDEAPILTMIGAHFKSKRNRIGERNPDTQETVIELESNVLRTAQANRATQIIQRYQIKFGYEHPILIAGDFNSNHNYAPEYMGFFRHTKLSDTVGLKKSIENYSDRVTHSFFGSSKPKHNQLDGILITPSLVSLLIESYVVSYKNEDGSDRTIPRTKGERKKNPSDHRPVTAIFELAE